MASNHTVLVVEDEPLILQDVSSHLDDCGFRVLEAENADQAVILLLQHPEIDLVFTDVRMPGKMDGLDLARWVLENRPGLPVMIATGDLGRATAMHELCGAETFLKPYDHEKIVERMLKALAAKPAA
ncbi:MAG TPA: response regulator [Rhizomicrobium sp.]|nr:response regulator [Rhizomicrobium sp.]